MLSDCQSLKKTIRKQRAACISRCTLVGIAMERSMCVTRFCKPHQIRTFRSFDVCNKLRQFHVAAFSKTQGGHHPNTKASSNMATQHLETNPTTTLAVACGHSTAPCAISLSTRTFMSKRCPQHHLWNCSNSNPQSLQQPSHTPNEPFHLFEPTKTPKLT